ESVVRVISLALRSGVPLPEIDRQLRGISSDRAVGLGPNKVMSVPDAIGIAIEKWMQDKQGVQQDLLAPSPSQGVPAPAAGGTGGGGGGGGGRGALWGGRRPGQGVIHACPGCGSQLAFIAGCSECNG